MPSEDVEGVPDTVENHHDDPVAQEWEIAVATGFHMFFAPQWHVSKSVVSIYII